MGNELNGVGLQENGQATPVSASCQVRGHVPPIFVVGVWRSGTTLFLFTSESASGHSVVL